MSTSAPYQLTVDGLADAFRVRSLTGKETISEAWWFDVVVTADAGGDTIERAALGQRATLVFDLAEKQRAFYGIVAAVRLAEVHPVDRAITYVVRVVPRLWLLRRKKRTRIFQAMRVPDIVSSVLTEAGIATRWQLSRMYPEREYCTQYEESDYHFIRRILAEAGVYFYFFGGGPVSSAALAADAAVGAVGAVGSSVVGFVAGAGVGSLVGAAVQMAETLVPGDTVVGADAASYPPVAGDDPAALAASTAAAMAPAIGDALGLGGGIAGAAIGAASAIAGAVIDDLTEGAAHVLHFMTNDAARVSTYDKITRFALRNTVRSSAAAFRDYDPDRPLTLLSSVAVSTAPFPPSPFEIAAEAAAAAENAASTVATVLPGPAAGALGAVSSAISTVDSVVNEVGAALGQKVPYEVYEHHDPFLFPKWATVPDQAPRILRQKRRRASIAKGEGGCCDFSPAHRFALLDHPASQLDGAYVITGVEHRGETRHSGGEDWKVYSNTFECAPAEMPYPPRLPRRKSVQVSLTATVTGPGNEEIYVDEKGQIKVQFHWDREGTNDDHSSCWIRTMQPWAGASWGHQFIPRVGMEVVVVFEGGDPDKPMVIGSLYNGTHPPPFKLPDDKTRSGIRTQSTPGGQGHNELSFEDASGREQVYVHAQKNLDEIVENDHFTEVRRDQKQNVLGNQTETVTREQRITVMQDRALGVSGSQRTTVRQNRTFSVGIDDRGQIGGNASLGVGGTYAVHAGESFAVTVGAETGTGQSDHYTHGSASIGASERLILRAEKGLRLVCGDTTIEITPDKITLDAPTIAIKAGKSVTMAGKGPSLSLDDQAQLVAKSVKIYSESASLELDTKGTLKGSKVALGANGDSPLVKDDGTPKETQPFSCKLTDYYLKPYANKKYHLMVEGARLEGETDGDGMVKKDIPKDAKQVNITVWADTYPTGRRRNYTLSMAETPAASTPEGAQVRLRHLGYFQGTPGPTVTDEVTSAVMEFQEDHADSHALDPTGQLDGATSGALEDVYGS
jgi:type VI secretion system secreted protein VgrG